MNNIDYDINYYINFGHHTDNLGIVFRHQNLILNSKKVLIAPCGYGQIVLWALSHGVDCYGIDISEFLISIIQSPLKKKVSLQNITEMKFKIQFDLIICADLLEHLNEEDIDKAILNIYNYLEEDGLFICKIGIEEIDDFSTDPTHITSKSFLEWHNLIKKNGFEIFNGPTELGEIVYKKTKQKDNLNETNIIKKFTINHLPFNIFNLNFSLRKDNRVQINKSKHDYVMTITPEDKYLFLVKEKNFYITDTKYNIICKGFI